MPRDSRPNSDSPLFFLRDERGSGIARLLAEDERHATRVLRLGVGDRLVGLDGRGGRHPLRISKQTKAGLELVPDGTVERQPAPGAERAALPWIELAIAWPRRNRVEDMVGRLVQLGVAAIRPLVAQQGGPEEPPEEASARIERVAREACKQSGRLWLPVFLPLLTIQDLAKACTASALAILDPSAALAFDTWLRSLRPSPLGIGTRDHPIVLVIGPEGGLTLAEKEALEDQGGSLARLGPHVLRVETAAEAAMAIAAAVHERSIGPGGGPGLSELCGEAQPLPERDVG